MSVEPVQSPPSPTEIREELARIVASEDFGASAQLTRFLCYVVEASLAGHEERIKERTVAIHALDRDADFDPRLDPIVRMAAGKLRRALERYYAGADSRLRIEIPKGGYRPSFAWCSAAADATPAEKSPIGLSPERAAGCTLPVVAVIPFVAFTAGVKERQLGDAIAQDVCVGLSKFTWFETIDYLGARAHCHGRFAPNDIASRLRADFCFTGTVRRYGRTFRTTVQLSDARRGAVIWAEEFDLCADLEDIRLLDLSTQRIVAVVGSVFGALATAVWNGARYKAVHQLSACEAVLCNLRYQAQLADGVYVDAREAAAHAIKVDPNFAWGWAAMATLHLDEFALVARGGARDASEKALACIQRALKADPASAFAHWALGLYHLMHGRTDETIRAADRAVEHARGSPFETGAAGAIISAAGDHDRGQGLINRALQISPQLPGWVHWGTAINDMQRGQGERALSATRRFSLPECFWDHLLRAAVLTEVGEIKEARAAVQVARRLRPELDNRPRELIGHDRPRFRRSRDSPGFPGDCCAVTAGDRRAPTAALKPHA